MTSADADFGVDIPDRQRMNALISQILEIADQVSEKDDVVAAKLKIDVRKWVVETILLKSDVKPGRGAVDSPISVTIGMDSPA